MVSESCNAPVTPRRPLSLATGFTDETELSPCVLPKYISDPRAFWSTRKKPHKENVAHYPAQFFWHFSLGYVQIVTLQKRMKKLPYVLHKEEVTTSFLVYCSFLYIKPTHMLYIWSWISAFLYSTDRNNHGWFTGYTEPRLSLVLHKHLDLQASTFCSLFD